MKKAQISFFIIIGIILVLMLGVYIAIRSSSPVEVFIEPKYQPLKSFVDSCAEVTARDAITLLGDRGGFLYENPELQQNPYAHLLRTQVGTYEQVYWWYDGKSNIPSEESITAQLNTYIAENLNLCLDDFNSFKDQFKITPLGNPIVNTGLNDKDTSISIEYPLQVEDLATGEVNTGLKTFQTIIPVRVKKAYELATKIIERENKDAFLEEKTMGLIGISNEDTLPYTGMELRCGKKTWQVSKIKETLQQLIKQNFQFLKIQGTGIDE